MQKQVPYTVASFYDIRTQGYYYIDKTMYLPKLEQYKHPVFLRPRRFGKSLFTDMMRYYYDIKYAGQFEQLFGDLWIGKNPTPNRNKYFFLSLNFSGMGGYAKQSEKKIENQFNFRIISDIKAFFESHASLLNLSETSLKDTFYALNAEQATASSAINLVTKKVSSVGGKIFVVIDEYDSLTNSMALYYQYATEDDNLYLDILKSSGFFRGFFETLKNNEASGIERVYITGILPITIADMNSGYNIAEWLTFEPDFVNMLGITEEEFDVLLDEIYSGYNLPLPKKEARDVITRYYNGYRFLPESQRVYNPSMTMYALKSLVIKGSMPSKLLDSNLRIDYNQIAYIFGRDVEKRNNIITNITENSEMQFSSDLAVSFNMEDYREGNYIAEGLFYSGILTATEDVFTLRIPNIVTYDMAISYFQRIQGYKTDAYDLGKWIKQYTREGDVEDLITQFFEHVIQKFPGQFFAHANESFYHGLLFHILFNALPKNMYEVLPEYNLPNGRADLMARTLPGARVMAEFQDLFEFKQVPKSATDEALEAKFREAKTQVQSYLEPGWRGIAVCFRGNKDFLIAVFRN